MSRADVTVMFTDRYERLAKATIPEWDVTDRLRKAMRHAGITSSALAEQMGVHRNTVANYLAGRTSIDRRTLAAWALVCEVPVRWLETGEAPRPEPEGLSYTARDLNPEPAD